MRSKNALRYKMLMVVNLLRSCFDIPMLGLVPYAIYERSK